MALSRGTGYTHAAMTEMDETLKAAQDGGDGTGFYNAFLNGELFVPLNETPADPTSIKPILVEADGQLHVMLFDSEERLAAWAKREVPFAAIPGHVLVQSFSDQHPWMLNVGTEFVKKFVPDEIRWLKSAVQKAGG